MKKLILATCGPVMRLIAVAALAAGLTACGTSTQLHLEDDSAKLASFRMVHRFGSTRGGAGIEVEASSVRGQGPQMLSSTDYASLGNNSIAGPVAVNHSARVQHAQLVYNHLLFTGRPIELEWFAGAAWVRTSWTTVSARPTDPVLQQDASWYGPTGGALARINLAPLLAIEGRYQGAANLLSSRGDGTRYQTELALAFRPAPALVLRGGLAEVRSFVRPEFVSTELSFRSRGLFANLGLEF